MKRQHSIARIDPIPASRTNPRLIVGACFLVIAIALSNARRNRHLPVRTTVELRLSDHWSLS